MQQIVPHGGDAGKREIVCSYVHFLRILVVREQHITENILLITKQLIALSRAMIQVNFLYLLTM